MNESLTAEQARELWAYDPTTGILRWNARPLSDFKTEREWKRWNTRFARAEAGCVDPSSGYRRVEYNGRQHPAHRIVWLIVHGKFPRKEIDHINGGKLDNRITNLREASRQENNRNAARRMDNTSGVVGVHWRRRTGKWSAQIKVNGRQRHLGYFDKIENAVAARRSAEIEYGFHKNHGRDPRPEHIEINRAKAARERRARSQGADT